MLRRLKRENRRLHEEREILAMGETGSETIRWIVTTPNVSTAE